MLTTILKGRVNKFIKCKQILSSELKNSMTAKINSS